MGGLENRAPDEGLLIASFLPFSPPSPPQTLVSLPSFSLSVCVRTGGIREGQSWALLRGSAESGS